MIVAINNAVERPDSAWIKGTGPETDVVLSSRVRLARNVDNSAFTHAAGDEELSGIINMVEGVIAKSPEIKDMKVIRLDKIDFLDRGVLVAKHLISLDHAKNPNNRAVVLRPDEDVSIMINEEDHLRIQALMPGMALEEALRLGNEVDDVFEKHLSYAFSETKGYLTACPTNVGTGLRASTMIHLPALRFKHQIGAVLNTISKLGFAIRGFYGEGTEAVGDIYQVSNQVTLGQSEKEIIENLQGITRQIIDQERSARKQLIQDEGSKLEDKVYRAYGLLTNARLITSEEAILLLSDLRLGVQMELIKGIDIKTLNQLMVLTRPEYLQKLADKEITLYERNRKRAELIRERLVSSTGGV